MTNKSSNPDSDNESTLLDKKISQVQELLAKTFSDYKIDEVFLSFNGGKDCTVLLDLVKVYLDENKIDLKNLCVIYIQPNNPFEEVEDFIKICETVYNIKIQKHPGKLKSILENICRENQALKAVVMGCRRTDPYCEKLNHMQPTDPSWPPLMRVNPLLDWNYKDIWNYILTKKVPYCVLYDEGMTSIGDRTNTKPNPNLQRTNPITNEISYRPAYELSDDKLERAGRT